MSYFDIYLSFGAKPLRRLVKAPFTIHESSIGPNDPEPSQNLTVCGETVGWTDGLKEPIGFSFDPKSMEPSHRATVCAEFPSQVAPSHSLDSPCVCHPQSKSCMGGFYGLKLNGLRPNGLEPFGSIVYGSLNKNTIICIK